MQLVWKNSNCLSEWRRDSTGVLPIRRQKVKTFQSSFRLIPALYFSLLFILYIGAEMIQINNKLQKWKDNISFKQYSYLSFLGIYRSYGKTPTCGYLLRLIRLTDSASWVSMISKLEKLREAEAWSLSIVA